MAGQLATKPSALGGARRRGKGSAGVGLPPSRVCRPVRGKARGPPRRVVAPQQGPRLGVGGALLFGGVAALVHVHHDGLHNIPPRHKLLDVGRGGGGAKGAQKAGKWVHKDQPGKKSRVTPR